LREHENEFARKGATLAAIGLGDLHYARAFREESGIKFPLLIDEQREAYRALELKKANLFHIFWKLNSLARKRAKAAGYHQHKMGKDPFQLGGSFVFGPGNVDHFVHISETFSDNAPPDVLLSAIP
jgi:AhpC/TSA antioxidant enzyme